MAACSPSARIANSSQLDTVASMATVTSARFSTTGEPAPVSFRGNAGETSAHWQRSTLIVESTLTASGRELHFRDHWSLSPDGGVLTMAHPDDELAGQVSVLERARHNHSMPD
jgi:hypothetical protein